MYVSSLSATTVAAKIRSLGITHGPYSLPGRLRSESAIAVSQRLAADLPRGATDAEISGALDRFATKFPQHFRTYQQATDDLRKARFAKQNPDNASPDRKQLAGLTPAQLLRFGNTGELPQKSRGLANG